MGFNSVLVVLNDRLDEIERDPDFGKKVARAIRSYSHESPDRMPFITGQTQVVSVEHADVAQVIRVGANSGRMIGSGFWRWTDDELIRHLESERKRRKLQGKAAAANA